MDLHGKSAIVTGSTGGIGQGIARALAQAGASVMLNGLADAATAQKLVQEMQDATKARIGFHPANMTKPEEIADLVAQTHAQFGSVDIIVNNAGIQHVAPVQDFPPEKWDSIVAINLTSAFHMIRHSVPLMKQAGYGRIINIASAHALVASPYKSAYVAAKHGLAGLTKTVALEVAEQHITVNAICPGYVWTPLVEGQVADTAKARNMTEAQVISDVLLKAQPTKQFTTIEQLGAFAVFLCSDAASNITGAILPVDGGWTSQ